MNLIGNQIIQQNLEKIIKENKISHSYLFVGPQGIGKRLFAQEFAKAILCTGNDQKPCKECKSCLEFMNNNHPDYYEIGLEAGENSIKIDTIRAMQSKLQELPIVSNKKVYVINDSEYMTKEAQNCLLKTLEEPPTFVTIILITADENKIVSTIQSRCLKFHFQAVSQAELKAYLIQHFDEKSFSQEMIEACQGSIGKAIQIYQNRELYTEIGNIFNKIEQYTLTDAMSHLSSLYENKEEIQNILEYLNTIFIQKAKKDSNYLTYIQYVEEAKKDLLLNANYDMSIDRLLYRIWEKE